MEILKNIDNIKDLINTNEIAFIYISSEDCNVCKVIYPRLEEMLKRYPNVKTARTDINDLPSLSGEYNVFTLPCILVFVEGKEAIREARYINIEEIEDKIKRYYSMLF